MNVKYTCRIKKSTLVALVTMLKLRKTEENKGNSFKRKY